MRLFDTHCHFETTDEKEIAAILERARAAGVERLLAVGGSDALNEAALSAASLSVNDEVRMMNDERRKDYPFVFAAFGYDRDQINLDHSSLIIHHSSFAPTAVGEIGLDYHYSPETRLKQMKLFASELERARSLDLPVIIHTREAEDDTVGLLKDIPSRGIIHCFTGTRSEAKKYLDLGFYVSISGIVTFKAADNVRETALYIPNDRILIETDSPFLAPVPMRGKANEPAFIRHTCEFLAKLRETDAETFAELTYENGCEVLWI